METGMKVVIGLGVASVLGYTYYEGAKKLSFSVAGFQVNPDGTYSLQIAINNPNTFYMYPVPPCTLNAYDTSGNLIGQVVSTVTQWVSANGTTNITGTVTPNIGNLVTTLANAIKTMTLPSGIEIKGTIAFGPFNMNVDTTQSLVPAAPAAPTVTGPSGQPVPLWWLQQNGGQNLRLLPDGSTVIIT